MFWFHETQHVVIRAGQSLSEELSLTDRKSAPIFVIAPPDWTPALLTFIVKDPDHDTWHDIFDARGRELMISVYPGVAYHTDPEAWLPLGTGKMRSGTRAHPILQEADREFTLVFAVAATTQSPPQR